MGTRRRALSSAASDFTEDVVVADGVELILGAVEVNGHRHRCRWARSATPEERPWFDLVSQKSQLDVVHPATGHIAKPRGRSRVRSDARALAADRSNHHSRAFRARGMKLLQCLGIRSVWHDMLDVSVALSPVRERHGGHSQSDVTARWRQLCEPMLNGPAPADLSRSDRHVGADLDAVDEVDGHRRRLALGIGAVHDSAESNAAGPAAKHGIDRFIPGVRECPPSPVNKL